MFLIPSLSLTKCLTISISSKEIYFFIQVLLFREFYRNSNLNIRFCLLLFHNNNNNNNCCYYTKPVT
jgi:hypothetical protein